MANNCMFQMTIRGTNTNVEDFLKILCANNNAFSRPKGKQFYRVFSANKEEVNQNPDGSITAYVIGDCAWSVEHAMVDKKHNNPNDANTNIEITDIETESGINNLYIEVYSKEPGNQFQEHMIFDKGKTSLIETADYAEYYWNKDSETFEQFIKNNGLSDKITQDDIDADDTLRIGGFNIDWRI